MGFILTADELKNDDRYIVGQDEHCQWFQCVKCGEDIIFSSKADVAEIESELNGHRCKNDKPNQAEKQEGSRAH